MKCDDAQNTHLNIEFLMWLNPDSNRVSRVKQQAGLPASGGRANEAVLCWAVAKDTSMQGGSHGDRCVREGRAE